MLTLWYIILGWKEYNKPFRKAEQPPKPVDSVKKPDLIPQKKNVVPTPVQDNNKSEPSRSIPIDPKPFARQPEPSFFNNKVPATPEIPEKKLNLPTPRPPEPPKTPEIPKMPEPPKTPEIPKMPEPPKTPEIPKMPEPPKLVPRTPEVPKTPEMPKVISETPKIPPRTPDSGKIPDFKLAPEMPKRPETPKTPEPPTFTPRTPQSFTPEAPRTPEGLPSVTPSRRPESVMPEFPASNVNPPPGRSEFPPFLPGAPQNKPLSRDDELFSVGKPFNSPSPNRPSGDLRDLSYAKGEFPAEVAAKVQDHMSKIPKYMEQSVISNPDSLESEEDDEDF